MAKPISFRGIAREIRDTQEALARAAGTAGKEDKALLDLKIKELDALHEMTRALCPKAMDGWDGSTDIRLREDAAETAEQPSGGIG